MGPSRGVRILVMLVINLGVTTAPPARVVERLQDGYGPYYVIYGYALGTPEDYVIQPVTNKCQCRRWCQTSPTCHSASVVREAEGGVQCRVSNKPAALTNLTDRPRLVKTPEATHFLEADAAAWTDLGNSGYIVYVSGLAYTWSYCKYKYCTRLSACQTPCTFAAITTESLLYDAENIIQSDMGHNVYLEQPDAEQEPTWGETQIPHSNTEINYTTIQTTGTNTMYYMKLTNGQPAFYNSSGTMHRCLCLENPFNLET